MPNRAVVMSGGGSKGAFQAGALDYLIQDQGLDFQVIAGVSTGSLNSVVLSQASSFDTPNSRRRGGYVNRARLMLAWWRSMRLFPIAYRPLKPMRQDALAAFRP